jgi:hypothetical protein
MVNVKKKTCQFPMCLITPTFNIPGEKHGIFCVKHALIDMVSIKSRKCQKLDCKTRSAYGYVGMQPTRCAKHKEESMVLKPRRRCEFECKNYATYGINSTPERCEEHKQDLDHDCVLSRCVACNDPAILDDKQLCLNCDGRGKRIRLARQLQVKVAFDQSDLPAYKSYDTIPYDTTTCGRERPDFLWDCQSHFVITETDESQHEHITRECERVRMINVTQALGTPCIWLRYNPDAYKGEKSSIRDRHRLDQLVRVVKECLNNPPKNEKEMLRVIYLFYDNYKMEDTIKIENIPM